LANIDWAQLQNLFDLAMESQRVHGNTGKTRDRPGKCRAL
jgi:hypothetical protein